MWWGRKKMRESDVPLFIGSWLRVKLEMVYKSDVEEREKTREKDETFSWVHCIVKDALREVNTKLYCSHILYLT